MGRNRGGRMCDIANCVLREVPDNGAADFARGRDEAGLFRRFGHRIHYRSRQQVHRSAFPLIAVHGACPVRRLVDYRAYLIALLSTRRESVLPSPPESLRSFPFVLHLD